MPVTQANKRQIEALRQRRAEREAHELNTMTELAKSVRNLPPLVIKVKTGDDGKMFGSVTSGSIADELQHQFAITLEKKKIHLEHPIRAVGDHEVELRLHHDITAALKVKVESLTPIVLPEAPAKTDEPKTEKRGKRKEVEAAPAEKTEKKSAGGQGRETGESREARQGQEGREGRVSGTLQYLKSKTTDSRPWFFVSAGHSSAMQNLPEAFRQIEDSIRLVQKIQAAGGQRVVSGLGAAAAKDDGQVGSP